MSKPRLVVTRRWPSQVERHLEATYDVRLNADDRPMTAAELRAAFESADAVLPTVSDRITAEVMDANPLATRLIANFGRCRASTSACDSSSRSTVPSPTP